MPYRLAKASAKALPLETLRRLPTVSLKALRRSEGDCLKALNLRSWELPTDSFLLEKALFLVPRTSVKALAERFEERNLLIFNARTTSKMMAIESSVVICVVNE